jgi:hypothetical protein
MVIIVGCSGSRSSSVSVHRDLNFAITTDEFVTEIMDSMFEDLNLLKLSQYKMTKQEIHDTDGTEYVRKIYDIGDGQNITFFESKETGLMQRIIITCNKATIGDESAAASMAVIVYFEGEQRNDIYSVLDKQRSDGVVHMARGHFLSVCEIRDDTYFARDYQPVAK